MTDLPKPVIAIPLRIALLCIGSDCEAVFYGTAHCPVCGESQFLALEKIIGTIREKGGTDTAPYPLDRGDA